jgi:sec-independent protein translocase protein TatC
MPVDVNERLTLFEHLDELRKRLTLAVVALAVGVVVAAVFNRLIFKLLLWPLKQVPNLPANSYQITTFSPAEPFMVSLKVWVVVATTLLFLGGVVFSYLIVLPAGLSWLLSFGSGNFNVQNRASDYFTFVAIFILAFGLVFELPVVLVLLAKVGVIDDKFLRKHRRYAIVICAVVAAVITPSQDAFSMIAMFIPLVVLYEISIPLARMVKPKPAADAETADTRDDGPDDLSRAPA